MQNRPSKRRYNELRNIILEVNISPYAEGSCMAKFGNTHVLCTASVDNKLPPWLRNTGKGLGNSRIRHAPKINTFQNG
jgi:ribonuclease PH